MYRADEHFVLEDIQKTTKSIPNFIDLKSMRLSAKILNNKEGQRESLINGVVLVFVCSKVCVVYEYNKNEYLVTN